MGGMAIEIRSPSEDELRDAMLAGTAAFAGELNEGDVERHKKTMPPERFLAAYDDGKPVGTAAAFPFDLTVPGGTVRAGGAMWVAVVPSEGWRGMGMELM